LFVGASVNKSARIRALAAARALVKHTEMPAKEVVQEAMLIAGQICIFTNDQVVIEEI